MSATGPSARSLTTDIGRPRIMGIVNVTPDSFSDGGHHGTTAAAIAHGRKLLAEGADILDIGGESTRPGATRPLLEEELGRVVPVIESLAADGVSVSVDTMRAEVARAACEAGAVIINDVSGGLADPEILDVAARHDVLYVAMHWRAHSSQMQRHAVYDGPGGVVPAVIGELRERIAAASAAGVPPHRLVLDPGLGFAKSSAHNWELLRALGRLAQLGHPILVGSSRKSFLGTLLGDGNGPRSVLDREDANTALTTLVALEGVWGVRVHEVRASMDAIRVVERFHDHRQGGQP